MISPEINHSPCTMLTFTLANKLDKKPLKRFYKNLHYPFSYMGLDTVFLLKKTVNNNDTNQQDVGDEIIASVVISKLSPENPQYLLHALLVAPAYRKQGIAAALLEQASDFIRNIKAQQATQNSQSAICLIAFADKALTAFYQKKGYIESRHDALLPPLSLRYQSYLKKQPHLKLFIFQP